MILIVVVCTLLIDYWQLTTATENNTQSCQLSLSIPLPHGEFQQFSNGSLLHQNILYHPDYLWNYSNTLYGCICKHQRKPCIRKCCQDDEVLYETPLLSECIKVNRSLPHLLPLNHQLVDELKHLKNLSHHFYLIQNKICPSGMYRLEPELYEEDNFVLLPNGSLQTLDQLLPQSQYCIDWQENLKNISVLVCHQPEEEDILPQTVIYPIGLIISILFLLATLAVYAVIPELRNLYGITLMCYVGCLTAAYCFLVSERFIYHGHVLCIVIAFIIHFSFLASFFWLNVMCFDIWWTFGGFRSMQGSVRQSERKKFKIYSIYAWGCASMLTIVCLIMDLHPNIPTTLIRPQFGTSACWFMTEKAKAIYFYGPAALTFICNIVLFISTAIKIVYHKRETALQLRGSDSRRHDDNKQWFNLYLKLFIVMGINWSMEIISWMFKEKVPGYVWYVTDLANTLQGVIIFIIFVWKEKIKRLLLKRLGFKNGSFRSRNSTRSGYCSSTSRTGTSMAMGPLQDRINSNPEMNRLAQSTEENDGT